LLLHTALPRAPYGSLEARDRVDPDGGWRLSPLAFGALWLAVAGRYAYAGWVRLHDGPWTHGTALERLLERLAAGGSGTAELAARLPSPLLSAATYTALGLLLGYPLLALIPRARPWIWTIFLGLHLAWLALGGPARAPLGLFLAHLLSFDPRWVRPRRAGEPETLFYDGACGLCHRFVRFLLAEDSSGAAFRFAPLQGKLFEQVVPAAERAQLPDSIVVRAGDGRLLVRSAATVHALLALGGAWGVLGRLLRLVPRFARDAGYDLVAAYRKRFFPTPVDACPLAPSELQRRFVVER
jgi:predicted DCC family thiol-disulfide oxidoreductase YuxK